MSNSEQQDNTPRNGSRAEYESDRTMADRIKELSAISENQEAMALSHSLIGVFTPILPPESAAQWQNPGEKT